MTWVTAAERTERKVAYADALLILLRAGEIVKGEGEKAMIALGLDWDDMRAARQRADTALKGLDHPITPAAAPPPAPGRPSAPPRPSTTPSVVPQQYHPHASRKRPTRDGDLFCSRHDDGAGAWLPPHRFALRVEKGRETAGARRSWCQDCTAAYQRARYLSVSQHHMDPFAGRPPGSVLPLRTADCRRRAGRDGRSTASRRPMSDVPHLRGIPRYRKRVGYLRSP